MSLSGSFNTTAYGNRYLTFSWTAAQSIDNNESCISWELKGAGGGTNYYMAGPFYVAINGEMVLEQTTRIELYSDTIVARGTKTVKHNHDGSLTLFGAVEAAIYTGGVNVSGNGKWQLDTIPRAATITSAPNFTDEDNPTITYENAAGENADSLQAWIYAEDDSTVLIAGREISKTGNSYTFEFTNEERATLQQASANSPSIIVRPYLRTFLAGKVYWHGLEATMTIVNADPVMIASVVDTNEKTVALTGDENILVKFYSSAKAAVRAEAQKYATINDRKYVIKCGGISVNALEHTFEQVDQNLFEFSAVDSRGNTGTEPIALSMIPYVRLTCLMESNKPDATGHMTVACRGAYFNGSFGAADNELTVQYRYAKSGGVWGNWTDMAVTITDNRYHASAELTELDYKATYTFECKAIDKLDAVSSGAYNIKSIPVFHWGENDFVFEVPVMFKDGILGDGINSLVDKRIDEFMADYVIAAGMEDMDGCIWYWRKWKSGRADCHGRRLFGDIAVTTPWGNLYTSASMNQVLPSGLFAAAPEFVEIKIINTQSAGAWVVQGYNNNLSASHTGSFCIYSPQSETILQAYLGFNVIGRWKI